MTVLADDDGIGLVDGHRLRPGHRGAEAHADGGDLVFTLSLLGVWYHYLAGIRHLIWDTGRLFEKSQADASAWFVLVATVLMTAGFWLLVRGG